MWQYCATTTLKFFQRLRQQKLLPPQWKLWRNHYYGATIATTFFAVTSAQCCHLIFCCFFGITKTPQLSQTLRAFITYFRARQKCTCIHARIRNFYFPCAHNYTHKRMLVRAIYAYVLRATTLRRRRIHRRILG